MLSLLTAAAIGLMSVSVPPPENTSATHTPGWPLVGAGANAEFGNAIANIGDINNDGYAELAVGAPRESVDFFYHTKIRIYSGKTGVVLLTLDGDSVGPAQIGWSVAAAGDVNNDGIPDIIAGAPFANSEAGKAFVFSGANGAVLLTLTGVGVIAGDHFGGSVAGIGDVNNDGFDDLLVGASGHDHIDPFLNFQDSGAAYVLSGANGAHLYYFHGSGATEYFGNAVRGLGDVNNDGVPDFIIGAVLDDAHDSYSGSAHVYSGADGSAIHHLYGTGAGHNFGCAVSGLGDVDNDGVNDFIVGAYGEPLAGGPYAGTVRVFSGATAAVIHTFSGTTPDQWFGYKVADAGDVNGDGVPDILVGALHALNNGVRTGGAQVFSGADGSLLDSFLSGKHDDFMGHAVAGMGDLNGDGIGDYAVASRLTDYNDTNSGSVQIFMSTTYATPPAACPGNANGDSVVNFDDITEVIANWLNTCP